MSTSLSEALLTEMKATADVPVQPAGAGSLRPKERLLILEPGRAERNYWADLWAYRELFAILAWRDVAVRYKQTVIGVAWARTAGLLRTVPAARTPTAAFNSERRLTASIASSLISAFPRLEFEYRIRILN